MLKRLGVKHPHLTLARCAACPLGGRPVVPGHGCTDHPDIAFVAEAPGETEVERGEPLIGRSGQLLRKIMFDLGIPEKSCWFTNTCLCHPKGNATPPITAVKACQSRLIAELVEIQPKIIVALGNLASKTLARHRLSITRAHGMYREVQLRSRLSGKSIDVGVVPTYHPAYLFKSTGIYKAVDAFRDLVDEIQYAASIVDGEPAIIEPPYDNYEFIETPEQLDVFLKELPQHPMVALDLETDKLDWFAGRILCAGFSWHRETAHIIDWPVLMEQNIVNIRRLNEAMKDTKLVLQNGIFDIPWLHHNGLSNAYYYLDTMLAHHLLDERQGTHGLERLAIKWYRAPAYKSEFRESIGVRGWMDDETFAGKIIAAPKEQLFRYNGADVDYTYRLALDLTRKVKEEGSIRVLSEVEMPAARVFAEFTETGLLVDRNYLEKLGDKWKAEEQQLVEDMRIMSGYPELNPNSTKQLSHIMYDDLKLVPFGGRIGDGTEEVRIDAEVISKFIQTVDDPEAREFWTARRTPMNESAAGTVKGITTRTTSAYMLYWLRQQHEFPNLLLKYRHIKKRRSLYYDGFHNYLYADGRIRPQYDLVATRTGRKSTEHPAMHNLPRGDEIYDIVIPDPGWTLIHADYSQAELRMMGHYSGDKALIQMLNTKDPHTETAMAMFHLTEEDVKNMPKAELSDKRIAAKMVTFGLPYGRSAYGLAPQLGITVEEAEAYISNFFAPYPGLRSWLDYMRQKGVDEHEVTSLLGRKRRFPCIIDKYHKREVMRQSGNMVIQAMINDLTMMAYSNAMILLKAAGIPRKPALHIHDSINLSVPRPFWVEAVKICLQALGMIPFETDVKFPAEVEVGDHWGGMITVHKRGVWTPPDPEDKGCPQWLHDTFPKGVA